MNNLRTEHPRPAQRWMLLVALGLFIGHSLSHAHVHFDAHEEGDCTLCAVSETGQVSEARQVDVETSERYLPTRTPVLSISLSARPYLVGYARAPPVSIS